MGSCAARSADPHVADLAFLPLLQNAALLLAMAVVFDVASARWGHRAEARAHVVAGVCLGAIGLLIMATPWVLTPGVVFDTRSVLLAVAGLVFGAVPTAIAMAMTAAYRLALGGEAAWVGVSVVLVSGAIGIGWRRLRRGRLAEIGFTELYLLGILVHVVMLGLMLGLPAGTAQQVLGAIGAPVIIIYPTATAVLGALMVGRLRRERVRDELREGEERLRLALAAGDVGLYDLDVRSGVSAVNEDLARMLGFAPGQYTQTIEDWLDRIHPDDRDQVHAEFQDHLDGRTPAYRTEYRQRTRDGTWKWILSVGEVTERDADGRPVRMVGTYTDVTSRREADERARAQEAERTRLLEEAEDARRALLAMNEDLHALTEELEDRVRARTAALEEANHDLEAFTYSVSHDLRAPLRAINGFSDALARDHADALDASGRHYLEAIRAGGAQMSRLIEDLLAYSQVGRRAVRREPVPLPPLVDQVRRTFAHRIEETGAGLEVAPDLPVPAGDPTLLEQILANLVGNALTYRRDGVPPRIRIHGGRRNGSVTITVADNGIGIPPEQHERIFEVFARLHSDEEYPGSGIGLAIARKAARLMGGELTVDSTPDVGSAFHLVLPAARPRRPVPPASTPPGDQPGPTSDGRGTAPGAQAAAGAGRP